MRETTGRKKIGKMDASLQVDFISSCCTAPSQVSTEKQKKAQQQPCKLCYSSAGAEKGNSGGGVVVLMVIRSK